MAASRFVEVTDEEISEIEIDSVPKIQRTCRPFAASRPFAVTSKSA
jgi:hypothetical protein